MIGEGDIARSSPLVLPKELTQPRRCDPHCFCPLLTGMLTFGLSCSVIVVTIFSWFGLFRGGFAWETATLFNIHPTMMTIGLIILPTCGVLSYRIFPFGKWVQKLIHAGLMCVSLLFIVVSMVAIETSKFALNHTHFWSVHTWCGLLTLIIFCTQLVCGITFLLPIQKLRRLKAFLIEWHRFFGLFIIWIATITILAGVSEYLNFGVSDDMMNFGKKYSSYAPEGLLGNFFSISVIINSSILTLVLVGPIDRHLPKTAD